MSRRPPPPGFKVTWPSCPLCGERLNGGESDPPTPFWCLPCNATWTYDGNQGEWWDPVAGQCGSIDPRSGSRCILAAIHKSKLHSDGENGWTDRDGKGGRY